MISSRDFRIGPTMVVFSSSIRAISSSTELADQLLPGTIAAGSHVFREIDRFGGDDGGHVGITEEGDDPTDGIRCVALTEEDVDQALLFLLPPPPIGNQFRTEVDRHGGDFLRFQQPVKGLLDKGVFKEFGLPKVDDGGLSLQGDLAQMAHSVGVDGCFP